MSEKLTPNTYIRLGKAHRNKENGREEKGEKKVVRTLIIIVSRNKKRMEYLPSVDSKLCHLEVVPIAYDDG